MNIDEFKAGFVSILRADTSHADKVEAIAQLLLSFGGFDDAPDYIQRQEALEANRISARALLFELLPELRFECMPPATPWLN